jgi:O-glycosyl hydrolase
VRSGPFYVDVDLDAVGWYDKLINDLGVTIDRVWVEYSIEPTKPASDPSVINLADFTTTSGAYADRLPYWQKLQAAANRSGVPLKTFASVLSPPAWMKSNASESNGGNLLNTMHAEFARFCTAFAKLYKQNVGADLYAISLQNEPAFAEPYASCVYDAQTYLTVAKALGPRLASEGLTTRLIGAEHMMWAIGTFETPLLGDAVAASYFDVVAVHDYFDGVSPTPASQLVQSWTNAATYCADRNRHLWMTETSGYGTAWSGGGNGGAMGVAQFIYTALKNGKANGWIYYGSNDLHTAGVPNGLWNVCKQFYRFIRPGAVMIGCTVSGESDVFAAAFVRDADQSFTVVTINTGNASRQLTLGGANLPAQLDVYQSTETQGCAKIATIAGNAAVTLPALSVTTLYAGPSITAITPGAERGVNSQGMAAPGRSTALRSPMYSLNGKLVNTGNRGAGLARGAYCKVSLNGNGSAAHTRSTLVSR